MAGFELQYAVPSRKSESREIREIVLIYIPDIKIMHVEVLLNKMKNVRHLTKSAENSGLDRI